MSQKGNLKLDWATHEAAKYACENWHYSKCMPSGKTVKIGAWENGTFKGVIVFSLGANAEIASLYGKTAELSRVALTTHKFPVTRAISISLRMLRIACPNLDSVISYADLDIHEGIIYKAGNWKEDGIVYNPWLRLFGTPIHPRTVFTRYGTRSISWIRNNVDPNAEYIKDSKGKKRFVLSLRNRAVSIANDVPGDHPGEGGATPTTALQTDSMNRGKIE